MIKRFSLLVLLCWAVTALQAQNPKMTTFTFTNGAYITNLSDNGLWATAHGAADNALYDAHPYLLNVSTGDTIPLLPADLHAMGFSAGVNDVSNDGKTAVGSYESQPAICNTETGEWTLLTKNGATIYGDVVAVTPDGKVCVGFYTPGEDIFEEAPCLWVDGVWTEMPGLPEVDICGVYQRQNRLEGISADGNIILGCMSFSYPGSGCCRYVYNRTTKTYVMLGKDEVAAPGHIDRGHLSNNGKYVTGVAHIVKPVESVTTYYDETDVAFIYNVETGEMTLLDAETDYDHAGAAISNDGDLFCTSPYVNPSRSVYVRHGQFWYSLEVILSERYGMNYKQSTGYENSGIPIAVSDDGKTLACMAYISNENYILTLPETYTAAASEVNLLSGAVITPETSASFATLTKIKIAFDREVAHVAGVQAALYKGSEFWRNSLSVQQGENATTYEIGFRTSTLEEGVEYNIVLPEGMFCIENSDVVSPEFSVRYIGRANKPVEVLNILPASGASVTELSYNSPVTIAFDVPIVVEENASVKLYQVGNETPICDLTIAYADNYMALYPLTTQYLNLGEQYIVSVPDSVVCDQMGKCHNRAFNVEYTGLYERPLPVVGEDLFVQDFSNMSESLSSFLLYEGDHRTPTSTMKAWGFDADNTPWNFSIHDDNETDYCAAATSLYSPAGASSDWMSTPQLYVPGQKYELSWKSQSYLSASFDTLRVYVLACDEYYSALNAAFVEKVQTEGNLVYCHRESPGLSEQELAGDWVSHSVSLNEYSGQNIYVVFANCNSNGSVIFVDDIAIKSVSNFSFGTLVNETVEQLSSVPVGGFVQVTKDTTYTSLTAFYECPEYGIADTLRYTDLSLSLNNVFRFEFPTPLPLQLGKISNYTMGVCLGDEERVLTFEVRNLAFSPTRRIVVEELTGGWCTNCPLGIVAFDYLSSTLKDQIIPIAIHTASGGTDFYDFSAYSNYLGLSASPTGKVNRIDGIYNPVNTAVSPYSFVSQGGNQTWTDIVMKELEKPTLAEVTINSAVYDSTNNYLNIESDVMFAVDIPTVNYNVSYIILEDGLPGIQYNGFYETSDPLLGDWGKNGLYNRASLISFNHVARCILGSYAGISGMVPLSVEGNKAYPITYKGSMSSLLNAGVNMANASVVCLLINANTGQIENAAVLPFASGTVGLSAVESPGKMKLVQTDGVLECQTHEAVKNMMLYTTDGKCVGVVSDNNRIQTASLPAGVYIVRIQTATSVYTQTTMIR